MSDRTLLIWQLVVMVFVGGWVVALLSVRVRRLARGRTSSEIAGTLYLSVRTVDTHLHRVYRKLAIHGRHQLAEALGTASRSVSGRDT